MSVFFRYSISKRSISVIFLNGSVVNSVMNSSDEHGVCHHLLLPAGGGMRSSPSSTKGRIGTHGSSRLLTGGAFWRDIRYDGVLPRR